MVLVCFVLVFGNGWWGFENGVSGSVYLAFRFGFVCFTIVFPVLMKKISRIMVLEMTDNAEWELVFSIHETGFWLPKISEWDRQTKKLFMKWLKMQYHIPPFPLRNCQQRIMDSRKRGAKAKSSKCTREKMREQSTDPAMGFFNHCEQILKNMPRNHNSSQKAGTMAMAIALPISPMAVSDLNSLIARSSFAVCSSRNAVSHSKCHVLFHSFSHSTQGMAAIGRAIAHIRCYFFAFSMWKIS